MNWGKILNYFSIEELKFLKSFPSDCEFIKAEAIVGRVYAERVDDLGNFINPGRKDKSGNAEAFHLISVSNRASSLEGQIVGLLHDIVEDGYIDLRDLLLLGFSPSIVRSIKILNHDKSIYPNYSDYITSIIESNDFIAIETKFNDMCNNLCPKRIIYLSEERQYKAFKKWGKELLRIANAYEKIKKQELYRKRRMNI